jgi:hypothetical protein
MDDVDQMVLPVEAGSSLIEIRFTRTADRIAGNALSILSLGISVVVFYMGRKRAA